MAFGGQEIAEVQRLRGRIAELEDEILQIQLKSYAEDHKKLVGERDEARSEAENLRDSVCMSNAWTASNDESFALPWEIGEGASDAE